MTNEISKAQNIYATAEATRMPLEKFQRKYRPEHLNAQNSLGYTLLHYAVARSNLNIVNFLISEGANPAIKNILGQTALDLANKDGKTKIANALTGGRTLQVVKSEAQGIIPFAQERQEQQQQQHGQR